MELKKKALWIVPTLLLLISIAGAAIVQQTSEKTLTNKDLHQQIAQFQSFNHETKLLLGQFFQNKITYIYFSVQLEQLQKQLLNVFDSLTSTKIDSRTEEGLESLTQIAIDYGFMVERIDASEGNILNLEKEAKSLSRMERRLNKLSKKYE
jgi:hypothetical protein